MIILNDNNNAYNFCLIKAIDRSKYDLSEQFRIGKFIFKDKIGDNIILFNTISAFMVEFDKEELNNVLKMPGYELNQSKYKSLIDNYILVPNNFDDTIVNNFISNNIWHQTPKEDFFKELYAYTIFTTTDCNARCFYCYEKGAAKIKMSKKTAEDVANFIIKEYNSYARGKDEPIRIQWFGGEPMYNYEVINIITKLLRDNGVKFTSTMITNGSLFTPDLARISKNEWNLKHVQITIDGTAEKYNVVKNYTNIKKEDNPFSIIINNIKSLIKNNIGVTVRLNADLYNVEDLKVLVKYLNSEIGNHEKFGVYEHALFETVNGLEHTEEERHKLYAAIEELKMILHYYGYIDSCHTLLSGPAGAHCMPDGGRGITIDPTGKVGQCEHMFNEYFVGSIYTPKEEWDRDLAVKLWYDVYEKSGNCETCPLSAVCMPLKNCINDDQCTVEERNLRLMEYRFKVRTIYDNAKKKIAYDNEYNRRQNCSCNKSKTDDLLEKVVAELELSNDYKSLTLWERIKLLFGFDVYRDPHKRVQDNFNGK